MKAFCDSSALVKLYADEFGSSAVRSLETLVVSQLARVEVVAALWRKRRLDELRAQEVAVLEAAFENDLIAEDRFVIVRVTEELLAAAARAVARHPLRAYDGVQLASALAARAADPDLRRFACFDERLASAAAAEGFQVVSG